MKHHYLTPKDSIQNLINHLTDDLHHTIHLSDGVYYEKLIIDRPNITLLGESSTKTILVYRDYSYKLHDDGLLYNTFRTSTVTVTSDHCKLKSLTIMNDAGHHQTIGQAIALSVYGDYLLIDDCRLIGNQDTLFLGPLPSDLINRYQHILRPDFLLPRMTHTVITNSYIEGNIDFIFGSGNALIYQSTCVFNADGYLSAPSTYQGELGIVFYQSLIQSSKPNLRTVLARPWRTDGRTIFYHNQFDGISTPHRFEDWDKPSFDFMEEPYEHSPLSKPLSETDKKRIHAWLNELGLS